jgi:hypothetical protein
MSGLLKCAHIDCDSVHVQVGTWHVNFMCQMLYMFFGCKGISLSLIRDNERLQGSLPLGT